MRRNRIAGMLAAWLLLPVLAACGGDTPAEQVAEQAMEDAADDAGSDVDVDIDGDQVKIEEGDSTYVLGNELPEDFPADEVPLVDGDIVSAQSIDGSSFTVIIETDASAEEAIEEAVGALEDAGFTVDENSPLASAGGAQLADDAYQVTVLAAEGTISYSITSQGG